MIPLYSYLGPALTKFDRDVLENLMYILYVSLLERGFVFAKIFNDFGWAAVSSPVAMIPLFLGSAMTL
jgi:hypothetical protein